MEEEQDKDMFVITRVSREDIFQHFVDRIDPEDRGGPKEERLRKKVDAITDSQMESLARHMAGDYCEQLYWIQIGILAEDMVKSEPECDCDIDSHDCTEHRVALESCDECKEKEQDCKLNTKGICSVCGEVVE
jgi:hypothetical protein